MDSRTYRGGHALGGIGGVGGRGEIAGEATAGPPEGKALTDVATCLDPCVALCGTMREIDESHIGAEALEESGRLGYEFYRRVFQIWWLRRV